MQLLSSILIFRFYDVAFSTLFHIPPSRHPIEILNILYIKLSVGGREGSKYYKWSASFLIEFPRLQTEASWFQMFKKIKK